MALYVTPVPNPPAGQDWSIMVPGHQLWDLVAVKATLTTVTIPQTGNDSSSNGRNLTFTNNQWTTYGNAGPFTGSPSLAVNQANGARGHSTQIGTRPTSTEWNLATLTVGGWVDLNSIQNCVFWSENSVHSANNQGWVFGTDSSSPPLLFVQYLNGVTKFSGGNISAGHWHFVVFTYDGTDIRFYIDGALDTTVAAAATVGAFTEVMMIGGDGGSASAFPAGASMAGWFVNASVLSGARIATYYTDATTVGSAKYKSDVLADSPMALWMLDDNITQTSRNATLEVSNGTTVVGQYPGGSITGLQTSFSWSWQTALAGTTQTPGAGVNAVAIPELELPAGYILESVTPDLAATDQWSNIAVWWDDTTGTILDPLQAYQYPPGATLVYEQSGATP